ncbi:MAG: hypothetical protein JO043_12990 [Candidatus Eremiobacteraeota bacterium]|nr:hypothetical protein [Candidatus Eremiobacteraeota bacterium]
MKRRTVAAGTALLACALVLVLVAAAQADQTYRFTGKDSFAVGNSDTHSEISYHGSESLRRSRSGSSTTYVAEARYVRTDQGASSHVRASYKALFNPSGEQHDLENHDPDYLTVLNQPFAVQLDADTFRDLARLRGEVPFDFPSPMTGSTLHGRIRRIGEGIVSGARALGVRFDAAGAMQGTLPDRPQVTLNGRIRMQGSAYYRSEDALLVVLDATLTISGNLANPEGTKPVTIVYRRTIRAEPPPAKER